ncbi:MAG: serine/threonine protein kinase [Deltaproteobacteria bacterium]|nr:serine/threonine protein kinase [Deltaproteobacteria bacterium]
MSGTSRYILANKIARGGMAEIYLGKQVGEDGFQRLVAIKRILQHYASDQEFTQMFRDEAHICKRLQHANIVRVEGFEEIEGASAIIMEFVDGADVRTLLHNIEQGGRRLAVPMACYIIAESARGLHYAHTKIDEITQQALGIVHRDISPQNILVSFEGEVKVTDFGIADAESKLTDTRPGVVKGKYSYMSPEQISAKPVDQRTDIFALSIVFWEMLAMKRLFQGENEVDTIQRVKSCRIEADLRQLNPEVDEELDLIIKKGLAKDPKKRYRSAADLEKEIRRYMSRKYPEFTPEDLGEFLKKCMENRRSESAAEIKRTLTETNQRPGKKPSSAPVSLAPLPAVGEGALQLDSSSLPSAELDANLIPKLRIRSSAPRPLSHPASMIPSPMPVPASGGRKLPAKDFKSGQRPLSRIQGIPPTSRYYKQTSMMAPALAIVAAIALLFIGARMYTTLTAQNRHGTVQLRTQPRFVRITVGDKPVEGSRYIDTTSNKFYDLHVPPGTHTLLISRAGFIPVRHKFTIKGGEKQIKDDVVLKNEGPIAAVKVTIKGMSSKGASLVVNDGYFRANVRSTQRDAIEIKDLRLGPTYEIKVIDASDRDDEFKCNFRPKSTTWVSPDELMIDMRDRKCSMKR